MIANWKIYIILRKIYSGSFVSNFLLFFCLPVYVFVSLSVRLSVRLSVSPSVCQSVCLSVRLYVCPVFLSFTFVSGDHHFFCLSVWCLPNPLTFRLCVAHTTNLFHIPFFSPFSPGSSPFSDIFPLSSSFCLLRRVAVSRDRKWRRKCRSWQGDARKKEGRRRRRRWRSKNRWIRGRVRGKNKKKIEKGPVGQRWVLRRFKHIKHFKQTQS